MAEDPTTNPSGERARTGEPHTSTSDPTSSSPNGDLLLGADGRVRCAWCGDDPLYVAYHDSEWGRPLHDERALFELVCLESFQSGLSWLLILRKREGFRTAFAGFEPERIAAFGEADIQRLMGDARIVRNRAKIEATVANARAMVALHDAGETLDDVVWMHRPEPRPQRVTALADIPSSITESKALARDLRGRGFRFVGPVVAYALMESAGVVDDHLAGCWVAPSDGG